MTMKLLIHSLSSSAFAFRHDEPTPQPPRNFCRIRDLCNQYGCERTCFHTGVETLSDIQSASVEESNPPWWHSSPCPILPYRQVCGKKCRIGVWTACQIAHKADRGENMTVTVRIFISRPFNHMTIRVAIESRMPFARKC